MTAANRLRIGGTWHSWCGAYSFVSQQIDASNDGVGFVCQARSTDEITHVGVRIGARTGTPPTYIAGIETVDASTGFPSATYKGGGSPASGTFTPPADVTWDGTWQWIALTNSYTPTLGELMAITVRYSSGTVDASNRISVSYTNQAGVNRYGFPYAATLTGGTWSGGKSVATPLFGLRTANGRYGHIAKDYYLTRSASTVGHRVAGKLNVPSGYGSTFKISSIKFTGSTTAASGKNPVIKIWDATSALASYVLDSDIESSTGSSVMNYEYLPTSQPVLEFGTAYYIGMEVADATNGGVIIYGTQAGEAADLNTEDGAMLTLATYNGSSWTEDTTVRPWMELIIEDWTEPSGGGAVIVNSRRNTLIGR